MALEIRSATAWSPAARSVARRGDTASLPVSFFLGASPHARAVARLDLGFGRSAALWRNRDDRVNYDCPAGHTFSLYTRGGQGTRRLDGAPKAGWTGAVCVLPDGASSQWEITQPFEFAHVYVPDGELRRAFAETFDSDARLMDLADLTYVEAPTVAAAFAGILAAIAAGDPLGGEVAMTDFLAAVFADGRFAIPRRAAVSGGLAPLTRKRALDFIEAHLDCTIRLRDLAAVAGLSEFHFQRGFSASCGASPHDWILRRRIDRAKALIAAGEPLAEVAAASGFSSQSHLTRAFRAALGVTPGKWRARS